MLCAGDCNDVVASIYPGAAEVVCDGVDQACDGLGNEVDVDGDGWMICAGDCDDADPAVNPDVVESLAESNCADGKDNDCDGLEDEDDPACQQQCWDNDGDGFEDEACGGNDCDDTDAATYPGADEVCDGADNDCNGVLPVDEEDVDGDGWMVCDGDCNDSHPHVYPGAYSDGPGPCDGYDNDCDGDMGLREVDDDGDGHLECPATGDELWFKPPFTGNGDCDDDDADVHPGADEDCGNGIDDDCNGHVDGFDAVCPDGDGDGFSPVAAGGTDCDDVNPGVNPGADEICSDGIDNNCNGAIDRKDLACLPNETPGPEGEGGGCGCAVFGPAENVSDWQKFGGLLPVGLMLIFVPLLRNRERRRR